MCLLRFEETPKKFNVGSGVRLIDILRRPDEESQKTEKPDMLEEKQRD